VGDVLPENETAPEGTACRGKVVLKRGESGQTLELVGTVSTESLKEE